MAEIDRDMWRTLDPLLDQALDLTATERVEWLQRLEAEAPTLARELRELLASEAEASRNGFLNNRFNFASSAQRTSSLVGRRIGDYTIDRLIGHGGMGTVWLARRSDGRFEGSVAIKFLSLPLLTGIGQERFRREGTMLARLAHSGVAKLLDAGVADDGQPYLVLEYVNGKPIDAYADAKKLSIADRVRLVLQVLSAVDHAHARLIIHRDIKPSNILVGEDGRIKLLDFGIAKLLDDSESAPLTREGMHALTPDYASPEQFCGDAVTTASDVYSLGVLLFRLLTGGGPFNINGRSLPEIARIVCNGSPPLPSATLNGIAAADSEISARAIARVSSPDRLQRQLRGDLDAIVLKAMHVEPARRYQSANAMADDLQRFLDGRPVHARVDSLGYRVQKFARRHFTIVGAGVAALALTTGATFRERNLRSMAEAETRKARAVEEYLVSVFDVADPYGRASNKPEEMTARALLDRGAARIDSALSGQPEVQGELRGTLGRVYSNLGLYNPAEGLLRESLNQLREVHGPQHATVATALDRLGMALEGKNEFIEAESLLREAVLQRRRLLGDVNAETAESIDHLATLLQQRGQLAAADTLFREALLLQRLIHGEKHKEVASSLNNLALLLSLRNSYDEAEKYYREALAIDEQLLGRDHPLTAQVVHNLAQLQRQRGLFSDAETLYRRALDSKRKSLGNLHPSVTINLNNLGLLLALDEGKVQEGEAMIREALDLDRQMFGAQHSFVAEGMRNLAIVKRLGGEFDSAEALHRQTLAMNRKLFGERHTRVALNLDHLALTLQLEGKLDEALPLFRESVSLYYDLLDEKDPRYIVANTDLARALREKGDLQRAEEILRSGLFETDTSSLTQRAQSIVLLTTLGGVLVDEGDAAAAHPLLEKAVTMSMARYGDGHWRTAEARLELGRSLRALGNRDRATALLRQSYESLRSQRFAQPQLAARAQRALNESPSEPRVTRGAR